MSLENKPNPELPPENQPEIEVGQESTEETAPVFNHENISFFSKMSEGGKRIANRLYEGLHRAPRIGTTVGKIGIAYDQFWLSSHKEKADDLKNKVSKLDSKTQLLDDSRKKILAEIEEVRRSMAPGTELLQLNIKSIDEQKIEALKKREELRLKLGSREDRTKKYQSERDAVADKLIEGYNEKLKRIGEQLTGLLRSKAELEALTAKTYIELRKLEESLASEDKKSEALEKTLRDIGTSEGDIAGHDVIKWRREKIYNGREKINKEIEYLAKKKADLYQEIARQTETGNVYIEKQRDLIRIKERDRVAIEEEPVEETPLAQEEATPEVEVDAEGSETESREELLKKVTLEMSAVKINRHQEAEATRERLSHATGEEAEHLNNLSSKLEDLENQRQAVDNAKNEADYERAYSKIKALEIEVTQLKKLTERAE